jgi:hypothetical protein
MMAPDRINLERGIDLSVLRDKHLHHHLWTTLVTYRIADEIVDSLYANSQKEPDQRDDIAIPLGDDNAVRYDGPGCIKCRRHWTDAYGELCPISDKEVLGVKE